MLKRTVEDFFAAPDDNPFLAIVRDPLSTVSRKNRSRLVGLSGLAIGMRAANLLPSQVTALGISLSGANQTWLIRFLYISIIYLLGTFVVYAISDYWSWQANLNYRLVNFVLTNEEGKFNLDEAIGDALNSAPVLLKADYARLKVLIREYVGGKVKGPSLICRSSPMAAVRLCLDLIVPVGVSVLAVGLLMTWRVPLTRAPHEALTIEQPLTSGPASSFSRPVDPKPSGTVPGNPPHR